MSASTSPIAKAALAKGPDFEPIPVLRRIEDLERPEDTLAVPERDALGLALESALRPYDPPGRVLSSIRALSGPGWRDRILHLEIRPCRSWRRLLGCGKMGRVAVSGEGVVAPCRPGRCPAAHCLEPDDEQLRTGRWPACRMRSRFIRSLFGILWPALR